MSIYRELTGQIQKYIGSLKTDNSFYQRIFNGSLTATELTSFLQNVSFLTTNSEKHLKLAENTARAQGHLALAEYFKKKIPEEAGHDQWGHADVAALKKRFQIGADQLGIHPEMHNFIAGNEAMIRRNPFHFFIYILFSEYFTVEAGPACLAAIEKNNQIPQSMMTIIGKHAELDRHHVADWAKDASKVGLTPEHLDEYRKVVEDIMIRYSRFTEALSQTHKKAA